MSISYDPKDKASIIEHARKLLDKSLGEVVGVKEPAATYVGKGGLGNLVEKYHFGIEPNNRPEPDFPEAGLELKTSPLKLLKRDQVVCKERLVLGIIDYMGIEKQEFESSDFWRKNASILLMFYLHEAGKLPWDVVFKLVGEWNFADEDYEIIRADWTLIRDMVKDRRAHELSEGLTNYLGACTKGASSKDMRDAPGGKAKQRALSFKQGYLNHVVAKLANRSGLGKELAYGRMIGSAEDLQDGGFEQFVLRKLEGFQGLDTNQLQARLRIQMQETQKNRWGILARLMLGSKGKQKIEEFEKAEITIRAVRTDELGMPREAVSFPAFEYTALAEQDWDDSDFKAILERRFLFFFFVGERDFPTFKEAVFWTMPASDVEQCEKLWHEAKELVSEGKLVLSDEGPRRETYFRELKNRVGHVRPHARNADDCYPLPKPDVLTSEGKFTKHSFWLNRAYIRDSIFPR